MKATSFRPVCAAFLVAVASNISNMATVQAQEQQQESCPLNCGRYGVCVPGVADFLDHPIEPPQGSGDAKPLLSFHQETSRGGFHCQCESGWTGIECNVEFQSCSGEHKCYHGGECVDGLKDVYGNDQHWCDCHNAVDENGNAFVGKYCEHPAVNYCDDNDNNDGAAQGKAFCIEGTCNVDAIGGEGGQPMCSCNEGFGGEHCQYAKGTVPECSLECQNGGHCVLGELPDTTTTNVDLANVYHFGGAPVVAENKQDQQHCLCRDGYDGELCQRKIESCGEGQCLWGAQCIEKIGTDGSPHYHCDCASAEADVAGQYCQYEKTALCGVSEFDGKNMFCTNGGTCKPDNIYEGCGCLEGFSGFECQYQTHALLSSAGSSSTTTMASSSSSSSSLPVGTTTSTSSAPNKEGTSICTREEDWGPGRPLSFCLHQGECKAEVTAEDPHAGCDCTNTWRGPHCEIHVALEDEATSPAVSTATTSSSSSEANASNNTGEDSSNVVVVEVFLISIVLVALVILGLTCGSMYFRCQQNQCDVAENAQFAIQNHDGESYQDEPNQSPHRDSVKDAFPRRLHSSPSSDPFVSVIESRAGDSTRQASRASQPSPISSLPPPQDEDCDSVMTPVEIC